MENILILVVVLLLPAAGFGLWWLMRKPADDERSRRAPTTSAVPRDEPSISRPLIMRGKRRAPDGPSFDTPPEQIGTNAAYDLAGQVAESAAEAKKADSSCATQWPETEENVSPAQAESNDTFPSLDPEQIKEQFYFCARLVAPEGGFQGIDIRNMSADIKREAKLQKYQLMLGHTGHTKWEQLRSDARYGHVVWAVPLRNRVSGISDEEHSCIVGVIKRCMRRTGGIAELPPLDKLRRDQQSLEELCNEVDMELAIKFIAESKDIVAARTCENIMEIAVSHGMEEVDSQLLRRDHGEQLFVLRCGDGNSLGSKYPDRRIASLELLLDLPRVTRPRKTCEEMFNFAKIIERIFEYRMVDAQQVKIDDTYIDECLQMVDNVSEALVRAGIRPGGKLARALFSY